MTELQKDIKNSKNRPDRVLGDEWKDWNGVSEDNRAFNEGKGTFFTFAFFSILLLVLLSFFSLYLVAPRLLSIHKYLYHFTSVAIIAVSSLSLLWYFLLLVAVVFGKSLIFSNGLNRQILVFIVELTTKLGTRFGISRDRMANSFIKTFNRIIEGDATRKNPLKPIVILPRCLSQEMKDKIKGLCSNYGLDSFIVGGGQAALEKIKIMHPSAIIGVACERDLIAGLKEVKANVPVFAISNQRPQGPCKNTEIDLSQFENAIKEFLKLK